MNSRTILWVDDQISELRSQILFLESKGYEVIGVSNGDDALEQLRNRRFDAILLDEMMPGRNGMETLQGIREIDGTVPVIMITKSEEEELMDRALGRRINDFLVKPVNPNQILLSLKKTLDETAILERQLSQDYLKVFQALSQERMEASTPEEWSSIHERMVDWEIKLSGLSDTSLVQSHREQVRDANANFGRFVEKNYRRWMQGEGRPPMSTDVLERWVAPHLRAGKKVFFFVIDCMRLDQWRQLVGFLEPMYRVQEDLYYSILPTATPFARNAIFSGMMPLEIARRHPQWWRGSAQEERSKNAFEAQLLGDQLKRIGLGKIAYKYFKTFNIEETELMAKQIPSLGDVPLVVGVINFLDILAHGRSTNELLMELAPDEVAFRSVMRSWFQHSALYELLRSLSEKKGNVVVITTDHGSVQVRKAAKVKAKREASTNVRYKYGDNLVVDEHAALIMKNPEEYGLPQDSPIQNYICAKEYHYFVYPTNFHEYERQYRGSFQHGGISMEEMIIPCCTLTVDE